MNRTGRFSGTLRYVYAHWPAYFLLYGGVILALMIIGASAQLGWLAFIPLTLAILVVLVYFLFASLWAAHQQYDRDGVRPHDALFDLGQIQAGDTFVYIDLGLRNQAIYLSRRLTTGRIIVMDVYNPQLTTSGALARWRNRMTPPPSDPRLTWRSGSLDLLPLPDKSVPIVLLCQIVSEFWQRGDRLALLQEAHRILTPNGRLLLAERVASQTNWLVMGPGAMGLPSAAYWHHLMNQAGFIVRKEQSLNGLIHCFRADKPTPAEARQLALALEFSE